MTALSAAELRKHWLANAERLQGKGHFANYSPGQVDEVLRKGYLGRLPPDEAIKIAKRQADQGGRYHQTRKFVDEMRECYNIVGEEVRETVLKILNELPPESYRPPKKLSEPPGYPFHFHCRTLKCDVYFKFQIQGTKKPQVLFWSCHPPVYKAK